MPQIMTIYGTRPEAIKVAPVIKALEAHDTFTSRTLVTGQHREMLDQVNELFGITPDLDLDILQHGQTLAGITTRVLEGLDPVFAEHKPDMVIVQGDTTTVFAAALAAFYHQIPVAHVEAGLRSGDIYSPFPEEANRKLATQLTSLHLAPTSTSQANLLHDGVKPDDIVVTGNTVIDALHTTVGKQIAFADPRLEALANDENKQVILVTTHRRENWGQAMVDVGNALATLAKKYPDAVIVLPIHRNPIVREAVLPAVENLENVLVTEPLPYGEFTRMLSVADVVLTDSGGVQEEAPSLGKPVLVMRENTERPEAVDAGTVRLIGTDRQRIIDEVSLLLDSSSAYQAMAQAVNPYGDGKAAERIVAAIEQFFDMGKRLPNFGE